MRTQKTFFCAVATVATLAALIATAPVSTAVAADTNMMSAVSADPSAPVLSSGVRDVVKMSKAGISADLITSYINNTTSPFYVNADAVIYLQQQGVSTQIVTTLIQRSGEMQRQVNAAYQQTQAAQVASRPAVVETPEANFSGALQARATSSYSYVAPTYPTYYPYEAPAYPVYYPSYYDSYSYGFWPPVTIGLGFGFGHFGGGHFGGGHFGGGHFGGRR